MFTEHSAMHKTQSFLPTTLHNEITRTTVSTLQVEKLGSERTASSPMVTKLLRCSSGDYRQERSGSGTHTLLHLGSITDSPG